MGKPRLLDLFCGAGGASMGYYRAGFEVVGVDIKPQPHYPFEFHQADALTYPLEGFDAYHASPPCQAYSKITAIHRSYPYPDLLDAIRQRLEQTRKPYVIENVPGSPLKAGLLLCGTMFGLRGKRNVIHRHRLFEANWPLPLSPASCCHQGKAMNVYTSGRNRRGTEREFIDGLGVPWAGTAVGLECIPPAYTQYIGKYLMQTIQGRLPLEVA